MAAGKRILVLAMVSACVASSAAAAAPTGRGRGTVARRFAEAYLRYIDGRGKASALPAATRAVRLMAVNGGKIPPDERRGQVVLVSLRPAKGSGVLIKARVHSRALLAEAILARRGGGSMVTSLLTPDFVQVFTHPVPRKVTAPNGAAAPEALRGYLRWAYGHGAVDAIDAATTALIARLAASPPNICWSRYSPRCQANRRGQLGPEPFVNWRVEPCAIQVHLGRRSHSGNHAGHGTIAQGKLQGGDGQLGTPSVASASACARGLQHVGGNGTVVEHGIVGWLRSGEETRVERRSGDDRDGGGGAVVQKRLCRLIHKRPATGNHNDVHVGLRDKPAQRFDEVHPGTHGAYDPLVSQFDQCGDRFCDGDLHVVFGIVYVNDVDVFQPEALKARLNAPEHAVAAVVPHSPVVVGDRESSRLQVRTGRRRIWDQQASHLGRDRVLCAGFVS